MDLKIDKVDYQEINDYKLLFELFSDDIYKDHYVKLENEARNIIIECINKAKKYVIVTNLNDNPEQTRYTTVINVEDKDSSVEKVFNIVRGIGEIKSIEANCFGALVHLKGKLTLIVADFTKGVVE